MSEKFTIPKELLDKIIPYEVTKKVKGQEIKDFVIQLPDGMFLHWIEMTDNTPCRVGRADMCMQRWNFIEQAEAICTYLKELWSEERIKRESRPDFKGEYFDPNQTIVVNVKVG